MLLQLFQLLLAIFIKWYLTEVEICIVLAIHLFPEPDRLLGRVVSVLQVDRGILPAQLREGSHEFDLSDVIKERIKPKASSETELQCKVQRRV